jgi:hypothetical protein
MDILGPFINLVAMLPLVTHLAQNEAEAANGQISEAGLTKLLLAATRK